MSHPRSKQHSENSSSRGTKAQESKRLHGYRATWGEFFSFEILPSFESAKFLAKTQNFDLRANDPFRRSQIIETIFRTYASYDSTDSQTFNINPIKLLNPFKALYSLSIAVTLGVVMAVDSFSPKPTLSDDIKYVQPSHPTAERIKKVFIYPLALVSAAIAPFSKVERTPWGGSCINLAKKAWSKISSVSSPKAEFSKLDNNDVSRSSLNRSMRKIASGMGMGQDSRQFLQCRFTTESVSEKVGQPARLVVKDQEVVKEAAVLETATVGRGLKL